MPDFLYHLIVIAVAAIAVIRGFRRGLSRQIPSLIGFCFGCVCAHIFMEPASMAIAETIPLPGDPLAAEYLNTTIAGLAVFTAVYYAFRICTGIIGLLMREHEVDLLNSLAGSLFMLIKALLVVGAVYNTILALHLDPHSRLMRYAGSGDGNMAYAVMSLSSALLGSESPSEAAHRVQLREASKISFAGSLSVKDLSRTVVILKEL